MWASFAWIAIVGPAEAKSFKKSTRSDLELLHCYASRGVVFDAKAGSFSSKNAHALALMSMAAYQDPEGAFEASRLLGFDRIQMLEAGKKDWGDYDLYQAPNADISPRVREVEEQKSKSNLSPAHALRKKATEIVLAHTYLLVASNKDLAVMAYRGTDYSRGDWKNVLTDLMFFKEKFGVSGKVHSGFYGATKVIWNQVSEMLDRAGGAIPLMVTGHSLGAAIGSLTTSLLFEKYLLYQERMKSDGGIQFWNEPYVQAFYSHGSPRVGNDDFVDAFQRQLYAMRGSKAYGYAPDASGRAVPFYPNPYSARMIYGKDIATRVPTPLTYRHLDQPKYYTLDNEFLEDDAAQKKLYWQNILTNLFDFSWDEFEDHDIRNYVEFTYRVDHGGADSGCLD